MPATAAGLGVTQRARPRPVLNGGAKYLKQQLDAFGGDVAKALAAYNAGPGAVQRFGGIPPYAETQNYVRIVQANAAAYRMPSVASAASAATPLATLPPRSEAHDHRPPNRDAHHGAAPPGVLRRSGRSSARRADRRVLRACSALPRPARTTPRAATRRASVATTSSARSGATPVTRSARSAATTLSRRPSPPPSRPTSSRRPTRRRTEPTTEEPTEGAPRPMTPDIFALQLASPLPPTPLAAAPTGAPAPGTAVPAEGEAPTAAIPAFPTLNLLSGIAPAQPGAEAPTAEAPTQGATPATPGGVPLPFLAGLATESQTDVKVELPTELPTADAVAPQADAATAQPTDAGGEQPSQDSSQQQPNPQSAPTAGAQQASKSADAPAPAAPTQPVTQAAPVAPPVAAPAPTALQRAIPLYRAPESAAQLIQIAADRGITHAKLNLKPVELGGIEVRLQSTPHGVTAQLVADSAEAAKLLTQAADDLRRDLADRNVNLLSLDVSTQQQYQEQQQAGSKQADGLRRQPRPGRRAEPQRWSAG